MVPKGGGRLWYWFSGRSDSPWYPSMRIFEQAAAGSWRDELDAVARELVPFQLSLAKLRGPNDA
jgi:hypothetical protein